MNGVSTLGDLDPQEFDDRYESDSDSDSDDE